MRSAVIAEAAPLGPSQVLNLNWYRSLPQGGVHAFWASFMGWALDAFDFQMFSFALTAIAVSFSLTKTQSGFIATASLAASAFGGVLAGVLADTIGRVRTLMVTIAVFAAFTFLSGLSQSYQQLLLCRAFQGLGFGGEWATGAVLIAEIASPTQRGRVLGFIQSAWAIGWGLALVAYTVLFTLISPAIAWRILFCAGILPALLILYARKHVREPRIFVKAQEARREQGEAGLAANPLVRIFQPDLVGTTLAASLLSVGAQGGYYSIFTWLPTFLKTTRQMSIVGSSGYLAVVITGSFLGYIVSGYVNDWIGRRRTFLLYAVCSAVLIALYVRIPAGANTLLLVLGGPLGFFASGIFSGFGSYLAELYPSHARGAGQGFCYNFGRAVGAFFPAAIGFLSAPERLGLAGAIGFGAAAYGLCLVALIFLPETRGKILSEGERN